METREPELESVDMTDPKPYVNPKAKEVLSKETLEKVVKPRRDKVIAERKGVRTTKKQKVPVYREPPRGQIKGPIVAGPTEWVVCTTCSRLLSTKEKPVRYGIRKRHAKRHLQDHRMGRIKRPVEPKAK